MRIQVSVPEEHVSPETIEPFLEGVSRVNEAMIRAGQAPTSEQLLAMGAVWKPEPPGDEHFDTGDVIAKRKNGDCDDWAPNRTATLRATGEDPKAVTRLIPSGPSTFHAVTQRGNGQIEAGEQDISVRAGMRPLRSYAVSGEGIDVCAIDPHDGREYRGSLLPAVYPLSPHCGPGVAVRGGRLRGGPVFEGRCDLPIVGSPMAPVGKGGKRAIIGAVPYGVCVTETDRSAAGALAGAVGGALLCGEAMGQYATLDRYKLLGLESALHGMGPAQIVALLTPQIAAELSAQKNADEMIDAMVQALQADKCLRSGLRLESQDHACSLIAMGAVCSVGRLFDRIAPKLGLSPWPRRTRAAGPFPRRAVGDLFGIPFPGPDVGPPVMKPLVDAGKAALHAAAPVLGPLQDALSKGVNLVSWPLKQVQAAVSLVPGIGSGISAALEAGWAILQGGSPLEVAIHAAYGAIPIPPGLRTITDGVLNAVLALALHGATLTQAAIVAARAQVPSGFAQNIFDTLIHLVLAVFPGPTHEAAHQHATAASVPLPGSPQAVLNKVMAQIAQVHAAASASPPKRVVPVRSARAPAAARPLTPAQATAAAAAVHAATAAPGSPGAPPGATHWVCVPGPGGVQTCRWY